MQLPPRLPGCERLVEQSRVVRVQVVEHDTDDLRPRVGIVHQPLHLAGEVLHCPLHGLGQMPVAPLRFAEDKEVAHAVAAVLIIESLRLPGLGG